LKKRERTLILMEILSILRSGPRGPTRLAQSTGLSFDKFMEFATLLESRRFVEKSLREGQNIYSITPDGSQLLQEWEKVWTKISPDSS
jgi:predicted transcriptional regulator